MQAKHSIALTAIAAALALPVSMESAHAAVIGSFDPTFGSSIPNLGFHGQIVMELSAGCTGLTGYQNINPVGYGYGCTIQATSAYIDFYNSKDYPASDANDPPSKTTLAEQDLTYADFGAYYIYGAYFDANGMLDGIDTNYSASFNIPVSDYSDPAYPLHYNDGYGGSINNTMQLYFSSGFQPSECEDCGFDGSDPAFLDNIDSTGARTTSNEAGVTFAVVPEPDSVALVGLGVGAMIARRRRRAKDAR